MKNWAEYFERNSANREEIPWEQGIAIDEPVRGPLIRSLQRFQIGESGEGRYLVHRAEREGDAVYTLALKRFLFEESVHAGLLERILSELGTTTLERHWSDFLFMVARRVMGLRFELMVLLTAEMIAKHYYRVLHDGITDPVLRTIFGQIVNDEKGHIAFHCDYLAQQFAGYPRFMRATLRVALWGMYQVAFLVVLFDHGDLFRALNVSAVEFLRDCDMIVDEVASRIFPPKERLEASQSLLREEGKSRVVPSTYWLW